MEVFLIHPGINITIYYSNSMLAQLGAILAEPFARV
jgi:hypothetical protein